MEISSGRIVDFNEDGSVTIKAMLPNLDVAIAREYRDVQIGYADGRMISPDQRRKAYALMGEIAEWVGDSPESVKEQMKLDFTLNHMRALQRKLFSLSDVDMNTASEFISFLIEFIIEHEIPTRIPLKDYAEDISRMIYASAVHRKCCLCGRQAEIHHLEGSRVGMGNDRQTINHIGRECLPLCREHHTIAHQDEALFMETNHLVPIKIDKEINRIYKLGGKKK